MWITIPNNIKSTILRTESAKEYMKFVKECSKSKSVDKSTCKFDGTCTMHQHVTKMIDTIVKLRSMGMEVSESFLIQFIINSLASEYGLFQINITLLKINIVQMNSRLCLFRKRQNLRNKKTHFVNLMGHKGAEKKLKRKKLSQGQERSIKTESATHPSPQKEHQK